MNLASGDVWTRSPNGWVTRSPTDRDHQRRAILRAWMHGDAIVDKVTHLRRSMRLHDATQQILELGLSEPECVE